jgi:hypothetical protein
MVAVLVPLLLSPSPVQARTFNCRAGDVACLIASIAQANAQPGQSHEIRLEAGTYTLTAVENTTDGPNGLPSITTTLTISGDGADFTTIERVAGAPVFRLVHVAPPGTLTLDGLTLRGGAGPVSSTTVEGGGIVNSETLTLTDATLTDNDAFNGRGYRQQRDPDAHRFDPDY